MKLSRDGARFRYAVRFALISSTILWSVKALELTAQFDFVEYGIYPRTLKGSIGIVFAPFIHGDVFHLISNTFPIIFLGVALFYFYHKIAWKVLLAIYLISGFWVWLAAREAYHIGASGVIYGLIFFLLVSGFIRRNTQSLAISFVVILLYGGNMFLGIVPMDNGVSWEAHLMGAIAGSFLAFFFRKADLGLSINREDSKQFVPINYRYSFRPKDDNNSSRSYDYTYIPKEEESE